MMRRILGEPVEWDDPAWGHHGGYHVSGTGSWLDAEVAS